MKRIQPNRLSKRQQDAVKQMRERMLVVADLLKQTVDNYDRAMADNTTGKAVLGKNTGYVGESWQIGDHEFYEWEKVE